MRSGKMTADYMRGTAGLPFYMAYTNPAEGASKVAFDNYFNPHLKNDSSYFSKLNALTKCIERNSEKASGMSAEA